MLLLFEPHFNKLCATLSSHFDGFGEMKKFGVCAVEDHIAFFGDLLQALDVETVAKHGETDFDLGECFHSFLASDGGFVGGSVLFVLSGVGSRSTSCGIEMFGLCFLSLWCFCVEVGIVILCGFRLVILISER